MAKTLEQLVHVTETAATGYWNSVLLRTALPATGTRQENFTPVEVILCLAAMFLVNHKRYGSQTNARAPRPVPELAALFNRPASSILAKMGNLDGSREHGGKFETRAAAILLDANGARLFETYTTALRAARAVGILEDRLPDFLCEGAAGITLLGQERLRTNEVEQAVSINVPRVSREFGLDERTTEKLLTSVVRVGQHRFARDVMLNCGEMCVFCGLMPGPLLSRKGLLRASHIKPWREADDDERLDFTNGVSACPNHDAAFDAGLLYVDEIGRICANKLLSGALAAETSVRPAFGQPPVAPRLILPQEATPPGTEYLLWHRHNVAQQ